MTRAVIVFDRNSTELLNVPRLLSLMPIDPPTAGISWNSRLLQVIYGLRVLDALIRGPCSRIPAFLIIRPTSPKTPFEGDIWVLKGGLAASAPESFSYHSYHIIP